MNQRKTKPTNGKDEKELLKTKKEKLYKKRI